MAAFVLALGFLLFQGCTAIVVDVSPKESTAVPRQNVTFLCRVGVPLQYCRIQIPGMVTFNLNDKQPPKGGVSYYGSGLENGQCGFTIESVSNLNNGLVKCQLGLTTDYNEYEGMMQLIVAQPPEDLTLELSRGSEAINIYKQHETLHAKCTATRARPVANISWYLDDEPLYDGISQPELVDDNKNDLYSSILALTRILQPSDNGKLLKCVATHPALYEKKVAARQLEVKYAPLPQNNPIDKFGYEIGKAGIISIEIDAHPKPGLVWRVRDQEIREGSVDSTGRIEAEEAKEIGPGHYIANLRIAAINKHDTETQFVLRAYNLIGNQEYNILISTSPEPEGVELGAGTIVAIIISIMILLVIVFVILFARITGRWCFSGVGEQERRITESDTESAEAKPKEKKSIISQLKLKTPQINLNMLKRNTNKESQEDDETKTLEKTDLKEEVANEEKKEETTKEGIVYAELDLVNQTLRPVVKNDDEKTEYAEIVYTQEKNNQDKKKEEKNV